MIGERLPRHRGRLLDQTDARERVQLVHSEVVAAARNILARGHNIAATADRLWISAPTLRRWLAQEHEPRDRGRPARQLPQSDRQELIRALRHREVRSVAALRERLPGSPRNAVAELAGRYRSVQHRRQRRRLCSLEWHVPGAVWAIDGTWLPQRLADGTEKALTVVDLGSGRRIAFEPIRGEQAKLVIACLERLIATFGAPLVIKWDNGSGFIAEDVRAFCDAHAIVLLHSPVRRPSYNGACEVHNRWAKVRVATAATAAGHAGSVEVADLQAALTAGVPWASVEPRRDALLQAFRMELAVAHAERGLATVGQVADHVRRSLERVAARRALQLCHILTIRGRDYRW